MLADREQAQSARRQARHEAEETRRVLDEVQAQEQLAKLSNGQAAYAALRELQRKIGGLLREEPSKRSLLLALGTMEAGLQEELARAPDVGTSRGPQVGDRVLVRSLERVGTLHQLDTRGGKAVVDLGATCVTVALDEVEVA